jgi:hypothetical protein
MSKNVLVRRTAKTVAALGIALGASLGSANAASAAAGVGEMTCRPLSGSNICLTISDVGGGVYNVHVGIDVSMSRSAAQTIINQPGQAFYADLIGDDPSYDNALTSIPLTSEGAWDEGLSAEFDGYVSGSTLNEDWEGRDEVYARVRLFDTRYSSPRTFTTYNVEHNF